MSGTVTDQNDEPVEGATVEIVGVDHDQISTDPGETKEERAQELLEEAKNPLPDSWDPDLQLTGDGGAFTEADGEYVAIHKKEDWGLTGWTDDSDLANPLLNVPADREIVMSVWDPSKTGFQDGVDKQLPGAIVTRDVVVEQLDPTGDVIDRKPYSPNLEYGQVVGSNKHLIELSLPAGVYKISAKGSPFSTTVVVGDVNDLRSAFADELETEAGDLSQAAEDFREKINAGKFVRKTVTTDANGNYSVDVGSSVKTVAVSAYMIDGDVLPSMSDPTPQDLRAWVANNDYEGSVAITLEPKTYDVPNSNADITVRKFSSPPYALLDEWADKWAKFRDMLENGTFAGISDLYKVPLAELDKENATAIAENMSDVVDEKPEWVREWEQNNSETWEEFQAQLDAQNRTVEQLRDDIALLEELLTTAQQSGSPPPAPDVNVDVDPPDINLPEWRAPQTPADATISMTQTFGGDVSEDAVDVIVTFSDGTSKSMEEQYWYVNKRPGRADQVVVDEYPVADTDAVANIKVIGVTDDGEYQEGGGVVTNPTYDGELLDLRSLDVSSVRPGVNEKVSIEAKTESPNFRVKNVTVWGPDRSTVSSSLSNGKATFTPTQAGDHFVRITFEQTQSGKEFVESVTLRVGESSHAFPPSVRVHEGTIGTYALAGDEIDDAKVSIEESGAKISATALLANDSSANEVHYYLSSAPSATEQSYTLRIVEGESIDTASSPSRFVGVYAHTRTLEDDATIYRSSSTSDKKPIPWDGSSKAGERSNSEQAGTVIQTYAGKTGDVTLTTDNDPGRWGKFVFRVDMVTADWSFPGLALFDVIMSIFPSGPSAPTPGTMLEISPSTVAADSIGVDLEPGPVHELTAAPGGVPA